MEYPLAQFFDGKLNPDFFEDLHAETSAGNLQYLETDLTKQEVVREFTMSRYE